MVSLTLGLELVWLVLDFALSLDQVFAPLISQNFVWNEVLHCLKLIVLLQQAAMKQVGEVE